MSCGEISQHQDLFKIESSRKELFDLYLKAIDMTPTSMIMQNGLIPRTDKGWYGNKVRHNFVILKDIWETLEDETS